MPLDPNQVQWDEEPAVKPRPRYDAPESIEAFRAAATDLGIDPIDLATVISYETAGTFDPDKAGPTTKWGQHRGLIQFGDPQRQRYGVRDGMSIPEQLPAVVAYLRDAGVQPGMGIMDVYSAINAGGVGRYNASDTAAGGAPGTVADKVNYQMGGHRRRAEALFAGGGMGGGGGGGAIEWAASPAIDAAQVQWDEQVAVPTGPAPDYSKVFEDPGNPLRTSNPAWGLVDRANKVMGSAVRGVANVAEPVGDWLESKIPLSGLPPEIIEQEQQLKPLYELADWLSKGPIEYTPTTNLDQLKATVDPNTGASIGNRLGTAGSFIGERVLTSVPDMAATLSGYTLPAYLMGRTEEIAERRVANDGRTGEPGLGDLATALPAAGGEVLLERLATKALPGLGTVPGKTAPTRIAAQTGIQSGTEAVQEGIANLGESAGTQRGVKLDELGNAMLEGGVVGGGLGGGAQTVAEGVNAVRGNIDPGQVQWDEPAAPQQENAQPAPQQASSPVESVPATTPAAATTQATVAPTEPVATPKAAGEAAPVEAPIAEQAQTEQVLPERQRFQTPDDLERGGFMQRATQRGVPEDVAAELAPKAAVDDVTGYFDGRTQGVKANTVARAQEHVRETGESAFYVDGDIVNLGGLNKAAQDNMTIANKHFRAMTDILRTELETIGADVVPMRTGGDELGAVVINTGETEVRAAMQQADAKIRAYAAQNGLDTIPHTKQGRTEVGVGLHLGLSPIVPDVSPSEIFTRASAEVNQSKEGADVARSTVAGIGSVAPEGQPQGTERGADENPAGLRPQDRGAEGAEGAPSEPAASEPRAPAGVAAAPADRDVPYTNDERLEVEAAGLEAGRLYSIEAVAGKLLGGAVGLNDRTASQYADTVSAAVENVSTVTKELVTSPKGFFRKFKTDTGQTSAGRLFRWYMDDEHSSLDSAIKSLERHVGKPQTALRKVLDDFGFNQGTGQHVGETYHEEYDAHYRARMATFAPTAAKIDEIIKARAKEKSLGFRDYEKAADAVGSQLIKAIQSGSTPDGKMGEVVTAIRKLMRQELEHRQAAGLEHGDLGPDYFPVIYDSAKVEADENAVSNIKRAYQAEGMPEADAAGKAQAFVTNTLLGSPTPIGGNMDSMNTSDVKERMFTSEGARAIMDQYRVHNVTEVVQRYVNNTARQAAIARRYGPNFSKWQDVEAQIKGEGGNHLLEQARRYVRDGVGIRPDEHSKMLDGAIATVRTAMTLSALEKSILPNMIEAAMPILQSNADLATSLATLKGLTLKATRVMLKPIGGLPLSKREAAIRELAEDLGAIAGIMSSESTMARFYGAIPENKRNAKWLNSFFNGIGMHQLADSLRENSVRAWLAMSRSLARDITGTGVWGDKFSKSSASALRDLGVPAGKERAFSEYVTGMKGVVPTATQLREAGEMGRLYSLALRRFVRQNQLEASGTSRPQWANTRYGAAVFQLQSYLYLFHKAANQKLWNQLKRSINPSEQIGFADRALLMGGMLPGFAIMAAMAYGVEEIRDELRELAGSKRELTDQAKLERAANMANLMGKYSRLFEQFGQQRYGGAGIAAGMFTPPSVAQIGKGIDSSFQAYTEKDTANAGDRKLAKAVYNTILEPIWQISLSAGPGVPFGLGSILLRTVAPSQLESKFVDATAGEKSAKRKAPEVKGMLETLSGASGDKSTKGVESAGSRGSSRGSVRNSDQRGSTR